MSPASWFMQVRAIIQPPANVEVEQVGDPPGDVDWIVSGTLW